MLGDFVKSFVLGSCVGNFGGENFGSVRSFGCLCFGLGDFASRDFVGNLFDLLSFPLGGFLFVWGNFPVLLRLLVKLLQLPPVSVLGLFSVGVPRFPNLRSHQRGPSRLHSNCSAG